MYVFGVDIPLVELLFALVIFGAFILLEITVVLILITYQMKNSKRLESEITKLTKTLLLLEDRELKEIDKLADLEESERKTISKLKGKVEPNKKQKEKPKEEKKGLSKEERKELYKELTKRKSKKSDGLLKKVDQFLKRWKKNE